jgi:hypothetical protein
VQGKVNETSKECSVWANNCTCKGNETNERLKLSQSKCFLLCMSDKAFLIFKTFVSWQTTFHFMSIDSMPCILAGTNDMCAHLAVTNT